MKGFKIICNSKPLHVNAEEVEDGLLTIHIDSIVDKDAFIYVGSVDYANQVRNTWLEFTPIDLGNVFEIKYTNIKDIDVPVKSIQDSNIVRPISKLEMFYKLESLLKKNGLL